MEDLSKYFDHSVLKPDSTEADVRRACEDAAEYGFRSVCVNPDYVAFAAGLLGGTGVLVGCTVGFPLGANKPEIKAAEAASAVADGAGEVDMVMNVSALKNRDLAAVERDIAAVRDAVPGICLKVIIEACLLTDEEKVIACGIAVKCGADFVKTSTGFSKGGATERDVRLMKETVGGRAKVKAAGGIRDYATFAKMVDAGAERIGSSNSVSILKEARNGRKSG